MRTDTVKSLQPLSLDSVKLFIVLLINISLHAGCFPAAFKHAVVQPLVKNKLFGPPFLSNLRPMYVQAAFFPKVLDKLFLSSCKLF